ncbi:hypothetical protein [Streptomyces sp. NPDC020965]|uniref:hypothetical protein n=1 Tax=Streptomyces sp. NPDC020965 TaxID=3365105 RepID=UPI0037AADA6A
MESVTVFGENLFPDRQPWDVVFDTLKVSHSEFWVLAEGGDHGDLESAIPQEGVVSAHGTAVGVPTRASRTRIGIALSVWGETPPDGRGVYLGTCRVDAPARELTCVNVEGREPGPALVLPDAGEYGVKAWRCASEEPERYDIRVWPCPDR